MENLFRISAGVLVALAAALALGGPEPLPPRLDLHVVSPLVQVFSRDTPNGAARARIEAARGEWEPFQIVVHAAAGALVGVTARSTPLQGRDGAEVPAPRLYRVGYVPVRVPSSIEGHEGAWPDPLIPDVDDLVFEHRRAFPFSVPAGETRAIWVDTWVPRGTAPGLYRGHVLVRARGRLARRVPVELEVHRFTLPATSTLPVTFGLTGGRTLLREHPGADAARLERLYRLAALRHRISLHSGGSAEPAPFTIARDGKVSVDFRAYDTAIAPFMDGTADPGGPAVGARMTAIDLLVPAHLQGSLRSGYIRAVVDHFAARGWLDRLFDYTADEPAPSALATVVARARSLHQASARVPRLVTHDLDRLLIGSVDIWCPIVNHLDDKPGQPAEPQRSAYDAVLKSGQRLWWYQSCMSHGCNIIGGSYFTGWPSYAIDAPAMAHRIFEWLTFRYHVGGELYYNVDEAYAHGIDPWQGARLFGGNGDGTLFYPGRPAVIGGKTDIPVPSIRLQLIREGLEDYEYLHLYAARFGRPAADRLAAQIAPRTFSWEHDGAKLFAVRHRIAEALDRADSSAALGERRRER